MQTTYTKEQQNKLLKGIYDICLREEDREQFEACNRQQFDDLIEITRRAAEIIGKPLRPDPDTIDSRDYQAGYAGKWRYGVSGTVEGCDLAIWKPHSGLDELQIEPYDDGYRLIYCGFCDKPLFMATANRCQTIFAIAYFMQTEELTPIS